MTDTALITAIRKILRSRPKATTPEAADLARYDQIVGLLRREENGIEDRHLAVAGEAPQRADT